METIWGFDFAKKNRIEEFVMRFYEGRLEASILSKETVPMGRAKTKRNHNRRPWSGLIDGKKKDKQKAPAYAHQSHQRAAQCHNTRHHLLRQGRSRGEKGG